MSNTVLPKFSLKITQPKYKSSNTRSKNAVGIVMEDVDGVWKVCIDLGDKGKLTIPFTDNSYDLFGKENVFLPNKDERGHWVRIIRTKQHADNMSGLKGQYLPFVPKWTVKGKIVTINFKKYFEFDKLVGIKDYYINKHIIDDVNQNECNSDK